MHASVPKGLKILLIKKSPPTELRGSVEPLPQSPPDPTNNHLTSANRTISIKIWTRSKNQTRDKNINHLLEQRMRHDHTITSLLKVSTTEMGAVIVLHSVNSLIHPRVN